MWPDSVRIEWSVSDARGTTMPTGPCLLRWKRAASCLFTILFIGPVAASAAVQIAGPTAPRCIACDHADFDHADSQGAARDAHLSNADGRYVDDVELLDERVVLANTDSTLSNPWDSRPIVGFLPDPSPQPPTATASEPIGAVPGA